MVFAVKRIISEVKNNKAAAVCVIFLLLVVLLSIAAPVFSPYDYYSHDLDKTYLPPLTRGHIFGTDEFGRDLFVRLWEGARVSLTIGVFAALVQMVLGTIIGGTAGIFGGLIDEILMRITDIMYSIPNLIIIILLSMVMGSSQLAIILALSITDWTGMARVVRVQTLLLKQMEFIQAARVLGAGKIRIMTRHILPNCFGPVLVNFMLGIPGAIFAESTLSFLGLGIKPPGASWGTLVNEGFSLSNITYYPWVILIPLCFIGLTMISFNILGDAIKDAQDSKS